MGIENVEKWHLCYTSIYAWLWYKSTLSCKIQGKMWNLSISNDGSVRVTNETTASCSLVGVTNVNADDTSEIMNSVLKTSFLIP